MDPTPTVIDNSDDNARQQCHSSVLAAKIQSHVLASSQVIEMSKGEDQSQPQQELENKNK